MLIAWYDSRCGSTANWPDRLTGWWTPGIVESRSDAVRRGLLVLLEEERLRAACTAYVEGYRRLPQSDDDLGWNDDMSRSMIAEEPW